MRQGLQFIVLIREDLKVEPFADKITKAALSPQLFKTPGVFKEFSRTRNLSFQGVFVRRFLRHTFCFRVFFAEKACFDILHLAFSFTCIRLQLHKNTSHKKNGLHLTKGSHNAMPCK